MSFMQPEEYDGAYLVVDGPMGVDYLPCDIADMSDAELAEWSEELETGPARRLPLPKSIKDYCENKEANSIERETGKLIRWSAPGYMDCTQWEPSESVAAFCDSNDVCPECFEACWDSETPCSKESE